jgi:hypothetical protein
MIVGKAVVRTSDGLGPGDLRKRKYREAMMIQIRTVEMPHAVGSNAFIAMIHPRVISPS